MTLPLHRRPPIMCLTQDGLAWSHAEQAQRLCAGGARWIQLRVKDSPSDRWLAIAREVVGICRKYDALCVINDSVEIAMAAGADGVHLGKLDLAWTRARETLGPDFILGGTINNEADVARARSAGCLDYVGVGPWRFTANKQKLAPILGVEGVKALIAQLAPLPAWVIGGVELTDLTVVQATGAAGVAVSSALFRTGLMEDQISAFANAWPRKIFDSTRSDQPETTLPPFRAG